MNCKNYVPLESGNCIKAIQDELKCTAINDDIKTVTNYCDKIQEEHIDEPCYLYCTLEKCFKDNTKESGTDNKDDFDIWFANNHTNYTTKTELIKKAYRGGYNKAIEYIIKAIKHNKCNNKNCKYIGNWDCFIDDLQQLKIKGV